MIRDQIEVIKNKNKDIAKFLGWVVMPLDPDEKDKDWIGYYYVQRDRDGNKINSFCGEEMESIRPDSVLPFNSSWAWLMSAVEYIEELGYKVKVCRKRCQICKDEKQEEYFIDVKMDSKIDSVHEAVWKFALKAKTENL